MRAACYVRCASVDQDRHQIETQLEEILFYCKSQELELETIYQDAPCSGFQKNPSGYVAMLEGADRREFDTLIVRDLSRFSRDPEVIQWTIDRLCERDVTVITL